MAADHFLLTIYNFKVFHNIYNISELSIVLSFTKLY